jgi:hypothetical protein
MDSFQNFKLFLVFIGKLDHQSRTKDSILNNSKLFGRTKQSIQQFWYFSSEWK